MCIPVSPGAGRPYTVPQPSRIHGLARRREPEPSPPDGKRAAPSPERRHLNRAQLAAVGVNMLPALSEEARKRQATSTGGQQRQLRADLPQADEGAGKAVEVAAR